MRASLAVVALFAFGFVQGARASASLESEVRAAFAELRTLRSFEPAKTYTLWAGGREIAGKNDDFLRRRTAEEIAQSGLSSGCGDFALLFIARIEGRGCETLLVDAAEISLRSLADHFSGHAVVAVRRREPAGAPWWLVDPTARRIISRDWSPDETSFTAGGRMFWIGYCGPLVGYAVRTPAELKRFYADTLKRVPTEVLNRTLVRLSFTIDPSLVGEGGKYLNPRLAGLLAGHDEIFARYGIEPAREIPIRLTRGGDDARSQLRYVPDKGWVSTVGLRSACSVSFLGYLDDRVRQRGAGGQ